MSGFVQKYTPHALGGFCNCNGTQIAGVFREGHCKKIAPGVCPLKKLYKSTPKLRKGEVGLYIDRCIIILLLD